MVWGMGRRYVELRCLGFKGWEVVVFSGLGAHLGLEGPLQGTKGDSRREARR